LYSVDVNEIRKVTFCKKAGEIMLGHIALIILLWFLISIVVALVLGAALARKDRYGAQSPDTIMELTPERPKQQPAPVEQLASSD
jgi:hypothetical protein